jgi:4-amino-4-deoxy-L-arabinose transferase-like glycosyltransferase
VVATLTVAALALRLAVAGIPSYWLDEAFTVLIVKASFGHALDLIPETESTPPLYYVLAWLWAQLFGTGEEGLRSLSAVAGAATVPVGYLAGARLLDRRTGVIAAALLTFNPFLVWFAQEARAYALMVLLCTIGLHQFLVWLQERRSSALVGWGIASALALATHYYAALMIGAELGWMLFVAPRAWRRIALATTPVLVAAGALLPLAIAQRHNRLAVPLAEESSTILRTLQVPKQFAVGFDAPLETLASIACLLLALAGAALLITSRSRADRDRVAPAVVVGGTVVLAPVVMAALGFDYVSARYEVAGLVPLALCVAAGCAAPRAPRAGPAIVAALCTIWLAIVVADARDPLLQTRADWRGAARAVGPVPPGGRAIVVTPSAGRKPFEVYLPDAALLKAPVAVVREVVLISVRSSREAAFAPRALPPGSPQRFLPPAFVEIGRRRTDTYELIRYRAPVPTAVTLIGLAFGRLDPGPFVVLVQRYPGRAAR